jgi:putative ABC transport system ATP-binding protein
MSVAVATAGALAGCEGVTVIYGRGEARVVALRDVDLEIGAGEHLALLGRSGSGKTTLLHVLGGLVVPSSGTVHWKDAPLSALDAAARGQARAQGIAYVFQGSNLFPHLTAWENVAFAARAASRRVSRSVEAGTLLRLVGLSEKADFLPSELSGGESQRPGSGAASRAAPVR